MALAITGATLIVVPDLGAAVLGPFTLLFRMWRGNPDVPLHQQLPIIGSSSHLGIIAGVIAGLVLAVLVGGYGVGRAHYAKRVAMGLAGLALYLALVASPIPYFICRLLIGVTALVLILCARMHSILDRSHPGASRADLFRPIKTVLFFIGVGYTSLALAWSLANPIAMTTAFAMLSVVAAFFTRIDEKRAHKTRVLSALGLLVFVISGCVYFRAPIWVGVVLATIASWRVVHALYVYGNSSQTFETTFDSSPAGLTDINYPNIDMLGRHGSRIVYHSPELRVAEDPNTHQVIFRIASVFGSTDSVLIGFGTPNAAVSVYDAEAKTWKRLSAFMFFRNKSRISAREELQVGLYFELLGLPAIARQRLINAMERRGGVRSSTCAHLNAAALSDAGFSLGGGREIARVYRPSHMASLIWRFGLEHDGKGVAMRVVNTSKLEVRDHMVGVWRKEIMSPIRLFAKILHRQHVQAPRVAVESQPVQVRGDSTWSGVPVTVRMSRPSTLGSLLTILWGRHLEFRVSAPGLSTIPELSVPLRPFPGPLSWGSKAKKHIMFSRPIVAFINQLKARSFDRYNSIPVNAALEMMSPANEIEATGARLVLWNCAIVAVGGSYELRLTPLKNQDPLSKSSSLRRFANWVLAKHVVATGYDKNTVFAGEAWTVRDGASAGVTLCLNNNSGTYKPTVEQLEAAAQLIGSLGMSVETRADAVKIEPSSATDIHWHPGEVRSVVDVAELYPAEQ